MGTAPEGGESFEHANPNYTVREIVDRLLTNATFTQQVVEGIQERLRRARLAGEEPMALSYNIGEDGKMEVRKVL